MMPHLVDGRGRQPEAFRSERRAEKAEHVTLCAVAPIVVGEPEHSRGPFIDRVEEEDRHFVIAVAIDELHQMIVVVQKEITERDLEESRPVTRSAEGRRSRERGEEAVVHLLGTTVERRIPYLGGEHVQRL